MKAERKDGKLSFCVYCSELLGDGCDGECARARFARLWASQFEKKK